MTKTCSICGADKVLSEFPKDRTRKDGYDGRCKPCNRRRQKKQYKVHGHKKRAYRRRYYAENRESEVAKSIQWNKANPEKYAVNRRRYVLRNYDRIRPTLERGWAKRRERVANAPGGPFRYDRPAYQARIALYGGRCAYCLTGACETLDHGVPLSRGGGHYPGNIYPACLDCNRRKSAKILWKEWIPPKARPTASSPSPTSDQGACPSASLTTEASGSLAKPTSPSEGPASRRPRSNGRGRGSSSD